MSALPQFPALRKGGSAKALTFMSQSLTFEELEKRAAKLIEQLLLQADIPAGSLIVFIGTVELEIPELFLAALGAGYRLLPIPDILTAEEVGAILDTYPPAAIFCTRSHAATLVGSRRTSELAGRVFAWDAPETSLSPNLPINSASLSQDPFQNDVRSYDELISGWQAVDVAAVQRSCSARAPVPDADFVYFLTSGTTGAPKLVRCSHHSVRAFVGLVEQGEDDEDCSGVESYGEAFVGYQSFAWVGGLGLNMGTILRGGTTALIRGYDFEQYRAAIVKHRPTRLFWLPMCFEDMCQLSPDDAAMVMSSVREVVYAGACFPLSLVRTAIERFTSTAFMQGYGSTEVGVMGLLSHEDHLTWFRHLDCSPGAPRVLPTISLMNDGNNYSPSAKNGPLFVSKSTSSSLLATATNVRVLVTSPHTGKQLPREEVGDIQVFTDLGCNGYYNAPEKDSELFISPSMRGAGGYMIGDSGRIIAVPGFDGPGKPDRLFLCCEGRSKDVVITRTGYNVYTSEIIHALSTHPALTNSQVAVAGVKDAAGRFDEVACWIGLTPSLKAMDSEGNGNESECIDSTGVKKFLRSLLAHYKVPVHVRFVEKMPLNRNGKPDSRLLAKNFVHRQQSTGSARGVGSVLGRAQSVEVPASA